MKLSRDERVGVVLVRQYCGDHDCRFEMESGWLGFSLFKTITFVEDMDPELVREWWFRFKFWAHVIDIMRCSWMVHVARACL